ncbi:amidohydrolase family protein [Elstera litoralis]|uniref:amidohydrolase family protein n=1 Tax=Elstera litoralis TaxID=552518 RepID=UPI000AAADD5C|nr:amidohydrolase family protein [Elstera litoralis]
MAIYALTGPRLYTGERFLDDHAVVIDGDTITAILPHAALPAGIEVKTRNGGLLVPGFIDAQVNGGGGVLFNATPTPSALAQLAHAHARYGTTALLPTFITDDAAGMVAAIEAVRAAIAAKVPGVIGLHLEGPFLSKARKGAHDPDLIRLLTEADADALLATGLQTVLLTLAPETVPPALIAKLAAGGIIVSLGHTEATYEAAMTAADAGARGVTHLFQRHVAARAPRPRRGWRGPHP